METIGFVLILLGGVNLAWFLLWLLISVSSRGGIAVSRKIGTDNEHTDGAEGIARGLGRASIRKAVVSAVILGAGIVLSLIGGR